MSKKNNYPDKFRGKSTYTRTTKKGTFVIYRNKTNKKKS